MPDKIGKRGCGKECSGCWQNKLRHGCPCAKKYVLAHNISWDIEHPLQKQERKWTKCDVLGFSEKTNGYYFAHAFLEALEKKTLPKDFEDHVWPRLRDTRIARTLALRKTDRREILLLEQLETLTTEHCQLVNKKFAKHMRRNAVPVQVVLPRTDYRLVGYRRSWFRIYILGIASLNPTTIST